MAVYTGRIRQKDEKEKALKDLSKKSRKAAKGEAKRKGMSNLFGTVGGMGLGALTAGLTGVTGGLALPLIMGLSSSAAKGIADAGSKGKFGKAFKTPGQVGEITSDNKYGYGREEAKDIQEELQESRDATSFTPQSMLEDVALSYLSAGVGGQLSDVGKDVLGGNFSKAITGVDDYSFAGTPISKALSNLKSNLGDVPFSNSPSQYSMRMNMEYGDKIPKYEGGGEVTLYDYFAAQGKTMGGSNTMSIAQKLGRR